MHSEIKEAIKDNTAANVAMLEWLKANCGAATSKQVSSMHTDLLAVIEEKSTKDDVALAYDKIVLIHLPAMEKRIVDAIKTGDDNAIISATNNLKVSTDQLEKVVENNQPISG